MLKNKKLITVVSAVGAAVCVTAGGLIVALGPARVVDAVGLQETVQVAANNRNGTNMVASLEQGKKYTITASGTYTYGRINSANGKADPECATLPPDNSYQRSRFAAMDVINGQPTGDSLDLYVAGQNVEWKAKSPDVFGCSTDNSYEIVYEPATTGPVNFKINDRSYGDNFGGLTVTVREVEVTLLETLTLSSSAGKGATSLTQVTPANTYRIEINGTYTFGVTGAVADAECVQVPPAPGSTDASGVLTPTKVDDDVLDVYVNGGNVEWLPVNASETGCDDATHTYSLTFRPGNPQNLKFIVNDQNKMDNAGSFTIRIFQVPEVTPPAILPIPSISLNQEVQVDSAKKEGASSVLPLVAGESYLLEVRGTYRYGAGVADAECSSTINDPVFLPDRFAVLAPTTDLLDLLINDQAVDWVGEQATPDGCNEENHRYRYTFIPTQTGAVNFKIADGQHRDNNGILTVTIHRIDEIPLGVVNVPATRTTGSNTPPLLPDRKYRFNGTGVYKWGSANGAEADTECSRSNVDPIYVPNRFANLSPGSDLLDIYVNNVPITWTPKTGGTALCDPGHDYNYTFENHVLGVTNLKIKDGNVNDNSGSLNVMVYLKV